MPEVQVAGFKISYQFPTVSATPGLIVRHNNSAFYDISIFHGHGSPPETVIHPSARFRVGAIGTIKITNPGDVGPLEIGFVQTLVRTVGMVTYYGLPKTASGQQYIFMRTHPNYPVKDGRGTPWYKEEPKSLHKVSEAGLTALRRMGAAHLLGFAVETWDEPKLGFPSEISTLLAREAVCEDKFETCLVVRHKGTDLYFLHSIKWEFNIDASNTGATAQHITANGGLQLGSSTPIPSPYSKPSNVKLDGEPANRCEIKTVDGKP